MAAPNADVPTRGDDAKRSSKNGKVSGVIDGVTVTITYGRPKVKGRTVWGQLIPFDKVWRTGSDEATTITFSKPAMVQGKKVAAGTYALFTKPTKGVWQVILNSQPAQWGAYKRDPSKDVLVVDAKPKMHEHTEELTFDVEGKAVVLRWEKLALPITVAKAG